MILKRSRIQVFWMIGLSLVLAVLFALVLSAPVLSQDDQECPGATEIATVGSTDASQNESFTTSGESFRVSYDVTFATFR